MSDAARDAILGRLRRAAHAKEAGFSDFAVMHRSAKIPTEDRYPRLKAAMEAIQAEFLETTRERWPADLLDFAATEKIATLAYGPATDAGRRLAATATAASRPERGGAPRLVPYDHPVDSWKRELFEDVDAGFTTTRGGIAETGGLILWPSPEEPRLLSLVPPVHFALLDTAAIHATFFEAMRAEAWAGSLPRNALLISGPSKTADIEQTLAYGVHGPKRLVVVAIR
jgi:L-lactate dehydrogenase complex protein LldG